MKKRKGKPALGAASSPGASRRASKPGTAEAAENTAVDGTTDVRIQDLEEVTTTTSTTTIALGAADIETFPDVVTSVDRVVEADAVTNVDRLVESEFDDEGDTSPGDIGETSAEASPDTVFAQGESESAVGEATEVAPEAPLASADEGESLPVVEGSRLEGIIESLLFAADRPLMMADFKRLLADRDVKRITQALENLRQRHEESGIQLVSVAGGWQLRTHPGNGVWVARLVAARPPRLSRAMMETLSIVAYRQPITRPEIDQIRGVDCGPVLHTLLDRGLIRVIGKKEEVGRPILYGTTPEFLKVFSLRDLTDLPTLRDFHELAAEDRVEVEARTGTAPDAAGDAGRADGGGIAAGLRPDDLLEIDHEEEDSLLQELDRASDSANRAARPLEDAETGHDDTTAQGTTQRTTQGTTNEQDETTEPAATREDTVKDVAAAAAPPGSDPA